MKKVQFHALHLVDRLALLRGMAKDVEKQFIENERNFKLLVDSIEDNQNDYGGSFEHKVIALNIILAKSDDLLIQIEAINELVDEARAQLSN